MISNGPALKEVEAERNALLVALFDALDALVDEGLTGIETEELLNVYIAVTGDSIPPAVADRQRAAEFVRHRLKAKP